MSRGLERTGLLRVEVAPIPANGLKKTSEIMVDNILTLPRRKFSRVIGRLDHRDMRGVDAALLRWLGLDEP